MKVNGLDVVHAGLHPGANQQLDSHPGAGGVGTHIGQRGQTQRQNFALLIQRQLGAALQVAPMKGGDELLAAIGHPLDRPLQRPRAIRSGNVLGINAGFHAETAAHIPHQHPYPLGRQAQHVTHRIAHATWHLRAHAYRQALRGVVKIGQHRAGFKAQGVQALVHDVQCHHMACCGKRGCGRFHAAVTCLAGDIVRGFGTHWGSAGRRRVSHVHDHRQLVVVHHHSFGGVAGLLQAQGNHRSYCLANKAHMLMRQHPAQRRGAR